MTKLKEALKEHDLPKLAKKIAKMSKKDRTQAILELLEEITREPERPSYIT